jgi:dUTP pyrophosphatase
MFTTPKIVFSKSDLDAKLPFRNSQSDSGYILTSIDTKIIPEHKTVEIDTGLVVEDFVKGAWGLVLPVETLVEEHGIQPIFKSIDNSFRGDLKIMLYNSSDRDYLLSSGDEIAKIVYLPLLTIEPEFIENNESLQ